MTPQAAYDELIQRFKETRLLDSIGSVLGWDERTYLPPKGGAHRAEQMREDQRQRRSRRVYDY